MLRTDAVTDCQVIIIGAGAMGSATAWWLARSGKEVLVLEQFSPGHVRGSSHGTTRIFRLAYPDPLYVDMARRALPLWREIEDTTGTDLLMTTGGIDFGDPAAVEAIASSLTCSGVPHQVAGPAEAAARWPGFAFESAVLYQPDAGRLLADEAVRTLQEGAAGAGADMRFDEPVQAIAPDGHAGLDGVAVTTERGRYRARRAVITAGAWLPELAAGLFELPALTVTREQVFHFPSRLVESSWPSFIHHGGTAMYGLQAPGAEGVKVAEHHTGAPTTATGRTFELDEVGRQRLMRRVAAVLPGLDPTPVAGTTCLYTNTGDESFIVERRGPIVVGSPCSGHGFKFVPLIGRRLAGLATEEA